MYAFLLNMYMTNRVDEKYLSIMVGKGFITETEKELILATPQINLPK